MNLVFIYGPPAAGKLTVAEELSKLTGCKVFHNHVVINDVTMLFPFSEPQFNATRRRLTWQIRRDIFEAAAENGISFITTFGAAGPDYFDFFDKIRESVDQKGGKVVFVQLKPSLEALMARVESDSRKKHGKIDSKEFLAQRLKEKPESFDKYPAVHHLTIDNTDLKPAVVASQIVDHYNLV